MRSPEEAQQRLEAKLHREPRSATSDQLLADYVDWWLATRASAKVGLSTKATYESNLRIHVVPLLGSVALKDLRPAMVNELADAMRAAGKAAWTIRGAKTALASVLASAVEDELVPASVTRMVKSPKVVQGGLVRLSREQIRTLLQTHRDHPDRPLWVLALSTGARQGEILGLEWQDLTLDGSKPKVHFERSFYPAEREEKANGRPVIVGWEEKPLKTERSNRTLPLTATAAAELRRYRDTRPESLRGPDALVFSRPDGNPRTPEWVTTTWKRALADAGLPVIPFHAARHTAACLMLDESNGDLRMVMYALGHSSITTTVNTYGGYATLVYERNLPAMEAIFAKAIASDEVFAEALGEPDAG